MKQFNLEEYLKSPTRKVITRDGRSVNIHCTNYTKNHFIIAEIEGTNLSETFDKDGKWLSLADSEKDLFFAPEKHEGWLNLYKSGLGDYALGRDIYISKERAEAVASSNCVSTVKIEWME